MRYVVETRIGFAWENIWSKDDVPTTFDSEEEAEAKIEEVLEMMESAWRRGDLSSPMHRNEFQIIALQDNGA